MTQTSCSDEPTVIQLRGTWVENESADLQFIEFSSENQGRFGLFKKDQEQYENFSYRLFENKIAIDMTGDAVGETVYEFYFDGADEIKISGLTGTESPKVFSRNNIKTENEESDIILGVNDLYFDFETGHTLRMDSILNDSRCPANAQCVWEGAASVRFSLTDDEQHEHFFDLATHETLGRDTAIHNVTYTLLDVTPYPEINSPFDFADYKAKLRVEK